jgi:hypothetical protein
LKRRVSVTRPPPGNHLSIPASPLSENARLSPVPRISRPLDLKDTAKAFAGEDLGNNQMLPHNLLSDSSGNNMVENTNPISIPKNISKLHMDLRGTIQSTDAPIPKVPHLSKRNSDSKIDASDLEKPKASASKTKAKQSPAPLPSLRFSPDKPRLKIKSRLAPESSPASLGRTAAGNIGNMIEPSSSRSDIYAWRTSVTRKKLRVSPRSTKIPIMRSRIPVPKRTESPSQKTEPKKPDSSPSLSLETGMENEHHSSSPGSLFGSHHASIDPDSTPERQNDYEHVNDHNYRETPISHQHSGHPRLFHLRRQFLQMLGLKELHLPGLVNYVQNVNFDNVDKSMLRHIKIQELYERTKVVELLHQSAKYHGAAENELGCVKGWLEDLMEERWIIECGNVDPIRNWLNQLVRWLWGRKEGDTTDPAPFGITLKEEAITMGDSATIKLFAPQKEHELFNLRDAGIELLRNGFRNKEKKMIEYWSKIRGISNISNAYGDEIIGIYMRKLTRWDKMELPENSITKRRMWYL